MNHCAGIARPLVYIVVLNYNGLEWLGRCLDSIVSCGYGNLRAIMVDNASTDESVPFVRENYPDVHVIKSLDNLGFSAGNNLGVSYALEHGTDYVCFLNTDTILLPGCVDMVIDTFISDKSIGAASPVHMVYDDSSNVPEEMCAYLFRAHTGVDLGDVLQTSGSYDVKWILGASMFISRQVIDEVGLLDSTYFMFAEDMDFCRRIRAHGYRILVITGCAVRHFNGGSLKEVSRKRVRMKEEAAQIYFLKDPCRSFTANIFYYPLRLLRGLKFAFVGGNSDHPVKLGDVIISAINIFFRLSAIATSQKSDRRRLLANSRDVL